MTAAFVQKQARVKTQIGRRVPFRFESALDVSRDAPHLAQEAALSRAGCFPSPG
jgi:hypothetical protein